MTSRRVRGFLLTVVILSAIVAIVSVFIPFNRRRDAINTLGEQSLSEATSLALSLEYYNGLRIQSLIDYPSETAFYQNLCAFLSRAKDTLSYDGPISFTAGWRGGLPTLPTPTTAQTCRKGWTTTASGRSTATTDTLASAVPSCRASLTAGGRLALCRTFWTAATSPPTCPSTTPRGR